MGWKMLNNEHCILYHKGDSIALIGVENDGEPPFSQFADLPKAMQARKACSVYCSAITLRTGDAKFCLIRI